MIRGDLSGTFGAARFGSTDLFVDTPGGRLFTRVWRELHGAVEVAPIVLIHDSLGCVELWRDFPTKLARATGRPVIAYDRLGYGKSDPYPGRLPLDFIRRQARTEFAALRDGLRLDRMILFGHSVGGGMAVAAAAAYPDATEAVITVAAQAFVEDRTIAGIREAEAAFGAPGQMERLARYHGEKARWVLDAWTKTWLSPEFAGWTIDDDLSSLRCPVLAIHGDHDEYGTRRHPEKIATLAPVYGQAAIIGDCGHTPHREKPENVLRVVRALLNSN